ncbi:hypothetical protein QSU92_04740 [Microbacterium sp. ET2]|uniref:hypothetical protein n=1 Tax=Microbacterium albipurpureum TaxID=3050384 RepID=UPI00259D062A|nr:hypothetical protein [Microbacterium sp. ET2 (Ac-2212)]WJL96493.1 hypothetical protein QSU92_04740 [Microbacterium sp. ET2 (Ac-2212)]
MDDRDLPEGVINADPAGGFGEQHDTAAAERSSAGADSEALDRSGLPVNPETIPDGDGDVESDVPTQGLDPDLSTDDQTEED